MTKLVGAFLSAVLTLAITTALCLVVIHAVVRLGLTDVEAAGAVVAACVLVHAERITKRRG